MDNRNSDRLPDRGLPIPNLMELGLSAILYHHSRADRSQQVYYLDFEPS